MKSFCCTMWESCVEDIQLKARKKVKPGLIYKAQLETIANWTKACPACGTNFRQSTAADQPKAQMTLSKLNYGRCDGCTGTGKVSGVMHSVCLGEGKLKVVHHLTDVLEKIDVLKVKAKLKQGGKTNDGDQKKKESAGRS